MFYKLSLNLNTVFDKQAMTKKITRGISQQFAHAFKQTDLYRLYKENENELIIGVRNNYLNLYYNCDSIATITYPHKKAIKSTIHNYYINGVNNKISKNITLPPKDIYHNYETIKKYSDRRTTIEKKAQSKLFLLNNYNSNSNWFCIDLEYVKQFENITQKSESNFNARFDIIAISKKVPHRVALIELKYGSGAIGGKSGIYKHVQDFSKFKEKNYFNPLFTQELIAIINSLNYLGVELPFITPNREDFLQPEFYFIILNNNEATPRHSSPKQTIAGYLFQGKRWGSRRVSKSNNIERDFGDITKRDNPFHASLLFSSQTLDNLTIDDIIDGGYDERVEPK